MDQLLDPYFFVLVDHLTKNGPQTASQMSGCLDIQEETVLRCLERLMGYGVPIRKKTNSYELSGRSILLDPRKFETLRGEQIASVSVFENIASTNTFLRDGQETSVAICIAESQWKAHGRFGRAWHAPFGSHIYLSILYPFSQDVDLSSLGLVISLVVSQTLETFFSSPGSFKVKWPNDIFLEGKKVGGTLVEFQNTPLHYQGAVVGIGLNINEPRARALDEGSGTESFMTCQKYFHVYTDRNDLSCLLIDNVLNAMATFKDSGFKPFFDQWLGYDYLRGKSVEVQRAGESVLGVSQGMDEKGNLMIKTASQKSICFSSGEASLRSCKVESP